MTIESLTFRHKAYKRIQNLPIELQNNKPIRQMIRANIPKEFWHISLDNFDGDANAMRLVEKYCNNLERVKDKGIGMMFLGQNGVGKTSLMVIIIKAAIEAGYKGFYITLPEIFKQLYLGWKDVGVLIELKKILYDTDFLAISELGKDYHRQGSELFMISEFDSIFRERRGDLKPVLMDTNLDENQLQDTYGHSLISLFKSRLKMITVKGGDYRKKKQERDVNKFFKE